MPVFNSQQASNSGLFLVFWLSTNVLEHVLLVDVPVRLKIILHTTHQC